MTLIILEMFVPIYLYTADWKLVIFTTVHSGSPTFSYPTTPTNTQPQPRLQVKAGKLNFFDIVFEDKIYIFLYNLVLTANADWMSKWAEFGASLYTYTIFYINAPEWDIFWNCNDSSQWTIKELFA